MKTSLINIAILLIVVLFLSTVNNIMIHGSSTNNYGKKFSLFGANGELVGNGKNNTSSKNLFNNSGDSANNNNTMIRSSSAIQQQPKQQTTNKQSPLSLIGRMRENGNNLTATPRPPLNANTTYYTFSRDRSEVSTPEKNSHTNEFGKGVKIALINPSFTSAAYNNSFYIFYEKHANTPSGVNVTSDPNLLSSRVKAAIKDNCPLHQQWFIYLKISSGLLPNPILRC